VKRSALVFFFAITPAFGEKLLKKPAEVPSEYQWVRTVQVDGLAGAENNHRAGFQAGRLTLRYLDPSVNALIGMQAGASHFNRSLVLEDVDTGPSGETLVDVGAHIGIKRKRNVWVLELAGATAAGKLAPAIAITGDYGLGNSFGIYHRMQAYIFVGDFAFESDQGFALRLGRDWEVTAGYRFFETTHLERSGFRAGIRYRFDSPNVPFIFPSVG
jgi:hypothetical protein